METHSICTIKELFAQSGLFNKKSEIVLKDFYSLSNFMKRDIASSNTGAKGEILLASDEITLSNFLGFEIGTIITDIEIFGGYGRDCQSYISASISWEDIKCVEYKDSVFYFHTDRQGICEFCQSYFLKELGDADKNKQMGKQLAEIFTKAAQISKIQQTLKGFQRAYYFDSSGLALVKAKNNYNYGWINTVGDWVIDPKFKEAHAFNDDGIAAVKISGKWGFINTKGELIVEPKFEKVRY
jgi:hypothetical protein